MDRAHVSPELFRTVPKFVELACPTWEHVRMLLRGVNLL